MEFRSEKDYQLCSRIRGEHLLVQSRGYRLSTELHMTNNNHFFRKLAGRNAVSGQMPLYEGKMIHQFDAGFCPGNYAVEEDEAREELLRKEIHRLAKLIREVAPKKFEGEDTPDNRRDLEERLGRVFAEKEFKLQYEFERFAFREVASSTNERTLIAAIIPQQVCLAHTLIYLNPYLYKVSGRGRLEQCIMETSELRELVCLANSLVLNFYLRSKVSTHVSVFQFQELPIPPFFATQKKKLADFADKLLKNPRDVKERAALEVFIARELYGLSLEDWQHLTGTFTFGSGATKEELDEIIRLSLILWARGG
jgi:hypothetical protein